MRVMYFTPYGGTRFIIPNAITFTMNETFKTNFVETIRAAGALDSYGDVSPQAEAPFEFQFIYPCLSQANFDAPFAAFSKRGFLDVAMVDGSFRTTPYKPISVEIPRSYEQKNFLPFTVKGQKAPGWRSFNSRVVTGTGNSFNVHTIGNADVFTLLTIQLSGQSSSITTFTITNNTNNYALQWVGATALTVGQSITINPGASTVKRNTGADEWPSVTLGQTQTGFFKLAAGDNAITVSPALPAGSVFTFVLRDAWY